MASEIYSRNSHNSFLPLYLIFPSLYLETHRGHHSFVMWLQKAQETFFMLEHVIGATQISLSKLLISGYSHLAQGKKKLITYEEKGLGSVFKLT